MKAWLWGRIEPKLEPYRRCRECRHLLLVEKPDGSDDVSVLAGHVGHVLDSVTFVNLREWVRIAWAK